MKVLKRDGKYEKLSFDKITYRLRKICNDKTLGKLSNIDPDLVAQKVVNSIYDGVSSSELDEEAARIAVGMTENPEYLTLAARIVVSNLHKNTIECFSEVMEHMYNNTDKAGTHAPLISEAAINVVRKYKDELNELLDFQRDYNFDYFGFKTLERSYLLRQYDQATNTMKIVERPQHMYMRIAIGIHFDDIANVKKTYHLISRGFYTHATPTMFNAGTPMSNCSSCFLLGSGDSVDGIYKTITDCARISKLAGGIGVHISNIRAKGSLIRGTNGQSDGIIPMLKVYNETARYINQSGKRKGSFAMYIEPWHADIFDFLEMKKNQGHEDVRARDLFYALWIPDLFMKKVEAAEDWYLMCPDECPGLVDAYGQLFEDLYDKYIQEGRYRKIVKAQDVWFKILESQIETGTPYLLYKDAVNEKSNQSNVGTIRSSNLCAEIVLYSDDKEYAVCNLCSIALPKYIVNKNGVQTFDHDELYRVTKYTVLCMNRVIDNNYYPCPEAKVSNLRHRPIGVGVQGLHDVFISMKLPIESAEARTLNREIFETIYYATLEGSMELAKVDGPYETFQGSPASKGLLQFDLWAQREGLDLDSVLSGRWDWNRLKKDIQEHGLRNSMLTCCQPTASTAQILGNTEAIEPMDSCIFKRRVLSGEFIVINRHLVQDLKKIGMWNKNVKDQIIFHDGSLQNISSVPQEIKQLYKTVWEVSQKSLIDLSADRAPFIDHTQSLNLFMAAPTAKKLTSMHFYAWKKGLKTGIYYLRSKASFSASKFSLDADMESTMKQETARLACSLENKDECLMCSG
jgi:ribonucleoside-diphosphate reductase alpha subunit